MTVYGVGIGQTLAWIAPLYWQLSNRNAMFGYSNICKHSVVQFQQCFALSPSLWHQIPSATRYEKENTRERCDFREGWGLRINNG